MQSRVGTPVLLVSMLAALPIGLALSVLPFSPEAELPGGEAGGEAARGAVDPGTEEREVPAETSSDAESRSSGQPAGRATSKGIGRRGPSPAGAARFPDGTWLPALNGVRTAPPFQGWTGKFAPVVRIARGELEWYVHANGSRSTVQTVKFEAEGRTWYAPQWVVARPRKSLPVRVPEDGHTKR